MLHGMQSLSCTALPQNPPLLTSILIWRFHIVLGLEMGLFRHVSSTNSSTATITTTNNNNSVASVRERTIPTERPHLSAKLVPTSADRGVTHGQRGGTLRPYSLFLDRSCYFFFPVVPHLCLLGWVDTVPDPLLLGKSGNAWNRTWTSGSVARNSDH
jgi:hypothetical protein